MRARDFIARQRWSEALAEARAVLDVAPLNADASALAQRAEQELVVEECVRNVQAALRAKDADRALELLKGGFAVRPNDPRLLELHRQAVLQQ